MVGGRGKVWLPGKAVSLIIFHLGERDHGDIHFSSSLGVGGIHHPSETGINNF